MIETDEREDDNFDDTPPAGPSLLEIRKGWAEAGNIDALLDLIRTQPLGMNSIGDLLKLVMRACEIRAKADPEGFSRELFAKMVGFNAFLLLRAQLHLTERLVPRGASPSSPSFPDLSPDVIERLLPRLTEMQTALAAILAAEAQTARIWGLSRAKEAKGSRVAATQPEEPRPVQTARPSHAKRTNARHPNGRANGTADITASRAGGGRRHD